MQLISIRCLNNLKESIKSEFILNRLKQFIAKKQELENSQVLEMLSAKRAISENSNIEQVYFRNR